MSVSHTQPSWAPAVAPCPKKTGRRAVLQGVGGKTSGCSGVGAKAPGVRAGRSPERERAGSGWWTGHAGPGSATPQTAQPSGRPVSAVLDPQSFIACGCGFLGHRELTLSWKRTFLLNPNTCIWKGKQQNPCNRRGGLRKPGAREWPRRTPPVAPWSLRGPGRRPPTLASVSPHCLRWRLLSTRLPSASSLEAREPSVHPRSQEARLPTPPVGSSSVV